MFFGERGEKAIEILHSCGYEAYFVGGCVRDALMGLTANDVDITTSALPIQTIKAFEGYRVIATGIKHGTVTVLIDGEPIEITTYRCDGEYLDHRHPESASFTSDISEDLCRRDFTVNAMAYSPKRGFVDLFGGREDLEAGVIRAVGDPEKRFDEDALRIARAVRFASQKDFVIEERTAQAIRKQLPLLAHVSAERCFVELRKLIIGRGAERVMTEFPEVISALVPPLKPCIGFEQHNPHHIYDVYRHTARAVGAAPFDEDVRLAALLHDVGKPSTFSIKDGVGHFYGHSEASVELARQTLEALKCDNARMQRVLTLIKYHDPVIAPEKTRVKRLLGKIGQELFYKLLDLKSADNLAQAPMCAERLKEYDELRRIAREITEASECFSLKSLDINGDDLIALGVPRGKDIGRILSTLLNAVMDGEIENNKSALIDKVNKIR